MEISEAESNSEVPCTQSASRSKTLKLHVYYMKFSVEMWNKLQIGKNFVTQTSSFQCGLCSGHVKCNVCSVLST